MDGGGMAELRHPKNRSTEYCAGQLHAAVGTLQALSGLSRRPMTVASVVASAVAAPSKKIDDQLFEVGKYLLEAMRKGGAHHRAAKEIFRALPDLLDGCGRRLLTSLNSEQHRADFLEGVEHQLAVYRGDGALLRQLLGQGAGADRNQQP